MAKLSEVASKHLDHEEADLEPFYLARKDTPEIKPMNRKFPDEATEPRDILRLVAGWGECRGRGRFEAECPAPGCGGADHPVRAVVSSNDRAGVGAIRVRIHELVVEF